MSKMKSLKTFFKIGFRISKSYIFLVLLSSLFSAIIPFINILFPKFLIDELLGLKRIEYLICLVVGIVIINLILNIINHTLKRIMNMQNLKMVKLFDKEMSKKILALDFEMIEDANTLDLKERAVFAVTNQGAFQLLMQSLKEMLTGLITLLGVIGILITFHAWVILFLLIVVVLISALNQYFRKSQFEFLQKIIPINRTFGHYIGRTFDMENGKDIRSYQINKIFLKNSLDYSTSFMKEYNHFYVIMGVHQSLIHIITAIQTLVVYGYMGIQALLGTIGIGSFTMYTSAALTFTTTTTKIIDAIGRVNQSCDYLIPFMEFMSLKGEKEVVGKKLFTDCIETIEFKDVCFQYPKSSNYILDHVSFKIASNDKISIVGLNGSGKTTLVKLLCRLYKPTSGEILINEVNILEYDYKSYLQKIATVFQDYKIFSFSLKENITLNQEFSMNRLNEVINKISLSDTVNKLEKGYDTNLKKDFDTEGIEFSGGQNQKVAIARALYKDSDLIILDEPTSALDPLAEYEIYHHFNHLVSNKMTIYISHRMSSSIFSDKILVIENGKSVAFDTHQNLIKSKQGLYYQLYMAQAKNYKLD